MTFLSLVIVLALVQWWGSGGPLQWDGWFYRWADKLAALLQNRLPPWLLALLILLIPVLILAAIVALIVYVDASLWLLLINIPVLLYSLGRGRFTNAVEDYLAAAQMDDSVKAVHILDTHNLDPNLRSSERDEDWTALHREAFRVFCYRGFERMFAVLFWFMVLGAPGALAYRLLVLYWTRLLENNDSFAPALTRWVTWVEWPAARLMGITWALVGNFEFCMRQWRDQWWKVKQTPVFLAASLRGALGAVDNPEDDDPLEVRLNPQSCVEPGYSRKLLECVLPMFSRALLAWVFVVAALTLLR